MRTERSFGKTVAAAFAAMMLVSVLGCISFASSDAAGDTWNGTAATSFEAGTGTSADPKKTGTKFSGAPHICPAAYTF